MKKWMIPVLLAVLLWAAAMPALADGQELTLSDAQGQSGQTVYMTVSLNENVTGDTVGISYSYDSSLLETIPAQCSWSRTGILQDFGTRRNSGAWSASEPQDLKGELCVLAFRVRSDVFFQETAVTCTVTVKKGSEEVAELTAEGTVSMICTHAYGDWKDNGALGHSRSCSICGIQQTQSHSWDSGVITPHPDDPHMKLQTFTCTGCGAQKVNELRVEQEPTVPVITAPQQPRPTVPTVPGRPEVTLPGGPGDHGSVTLPQGTLEHDHDHDHTHSDGSTSDPNGNRSPVGVTVVLLLAAALIGGAMWFIKKKK